MKKLLYIIANPNPTELSFGRKVGDFLVNQYRAQHPDHTVDVKDLYLEGVSLLTDTYLSGRRKQAAGQSAAMLETERQAVESVDLTVDEFLKYDRYVIVVPMWNFGVPPLLKAYIDNILVPGKTFAYTAQGAAGLLNGTDRKMVIVEASGGFYSEGEASKLNHCSGYLRDIFGFIGINQLKVIPVEGTAIPEHNETVLENSKKAAMLALTEF